MNAQSTIFAASLVDWMADKMVTTSWGNDPEIKHGS